jgi:hypothetical protein
MIVQLKNTHRHCSLEYRTECNVIKNPDIVVYSYWLLWSFINIPLYFIEEQETRIRALTNCSCICTTLVPTSLVQDRTHAKKFVGSIEHSVHTSRVMIMPVHLSWWISGQLRSCNRSGLQSSCLRRRARTGLWEKQTICVLSSAIPSSVTKPILYVSCHPTYWLQG